MELLYLEEKTKAFQSSDQSNELKQKVRSNEQIAVK
jgi:hypothetical protein